VIAVVNFYEVVVGFAILYGSCGRVTGTSSNLGVFQGSLTAFYFSLITMTTVGFGDFIPVTRLGRGLVIAQITTTIVFVLFLLPALVSVFSSSLTRRRAKDSTWPLPVVFFKLWILYSASARLKTTRTSGSGVSPFAVTSEST